MLRVPLCALAAVLALCSCSSLSSWDRAKLLAPDPTVTTSVPIITSEYAAALAAAQAAPRDRAALARLADAGVSSITI